MKFTFFWQIMQGMTQNCLSCTTNQVLIIIFEGVTSDE